MVRKGHSIADVRKNGKKDKADEDKIDDVSAGKGAANKLAGVGQAAADEKKKKKPPYMD
jgi:hypothetical protein